jgi:hypothetical protein
MSLSVHLEAMQAVLPLLMPPSAPAPLLVEAFWKTIVLESEAKLFFNPLFAFVVMWHVRCVCVVSTLYQPLSWLY